MTQMVRVLVFLVVVGVSGCGDTKSTTVPTDPENVKKLEDQQKKASQGEK